MAQNRTIKITRNLILGGMSASSYFPRKGQYQAAIGIDPDMPKDDTVLNPSGLIRPTAMAKFSGTEEGWRGFLSDLLPESWWRAASRLGLCQDELRERHGANPIAAGGRCFNCCRWRMSWDNSKAAKLWE